MTHDQLVTLDDDTRITVRGEHPALERARRYLIAQVAGRTGVRWRAAGETGGQGPRICLRLARPPGAGERYTISVSSTPEHVEVDIEAHAVSVVLAAVGYFARKLVMEAGRVRVPTGRWERTPAHPVRGQVLANHKQTNTYDLWSYEQWEECLTELAAWGNNLVITYPAHPSRWHGALPFAPRPWFDSPDRQVEWERQYAIQRRLPRLCHELGLRFGAYISPNDVWPQQVLDNPGWAPHSSAFVCANVLAAREAITALRRRVLSDLPALDVLFIPSKDDGGCPGCEKCQPWVGTYVQLVEEQAALAREYHPDCAVWISQQGLPWDQTVQLVNWLRDERPGYVEAVAYGPFSEIMAFGAPDGRVESKSPDELLWDAPALLASELPADYSLVLYPDEVHPFRAQYPIRGMDPVLQFVWGREDAPVPRIRDTVEQFSRTASPSSGAAPYSEGDTDDVNKFAWSELLWEPHLRADEIARRYADWYFGPAARESGGALLLGIEDALHAPLGTAAGRSLPDQLRRVRGASRVPSPSTWRWTCIEYCVALLEHVGSVHARDAELAATLRFRIAEWYDDPDLLPGLLRVIDYLRTRLGEGQATAKILDRLCRAVFDSHRLRLRSVARVQLSYHGLDVLLGTYEALATQLRNGEIEDWPTQRRAVLRPLASAEELRCSRSAGAAVLEHLVEFPWESGATRWHTA